VVADGSIVIEIADHHQNHLKTVHASVIYAAAEAASGEWVIRHLSPLLPDALAMNRKSAIHYRKPAFGNLSATVTKAPESTSDLAAQVVARGLGRANIDVEVRASDEVVATGTFEWVFQHNAIRR
jgi:acyl-coenzyme A thioesterase PaaI-like protein